MFIKELNEENIPFIARKTRVTRERLIEAMKEAQNYDFVYFLRFDHYKIQSMKVLNEVLTSKIQKALMDDSAWTEQEDILVEDVEAKGLNNDGPVVA